MEDVLTSYLHYCQRRGFSASTLSSYKIIVTLWNAHLDKLGIDQPGPAEVESFLDRPDLAPKTRAGYQSWLTPFCRWAHEEGIYERNPTAKLHRPIIPETIPRVISEDDLERAILATRESWTDAKGRQRTPQGPRMRLWLLLAAKAGLRAKEIAGIRSEDVKLERALLVVSNPKGRRQRVVELNSDICEAFRAYGLRDEYLFPGQRGRCHVTPNGVSAQIATYLNDLGVDATAHSLRHRFASQLYDLTLDLFYVQESLGHQNPMTTKRYVHLNQGKYGTKLDQL